MLDGHQVTKLQPLGLFEQIPAEVFGVVLSVDDSVVEFDVVDVWDEATTVW